MDCDSTTLVGADAHSMNNGDIYGRYIAKHSAVHEKLFAIIENHPEPDFFPPRAFPDIDVVKKAAKATGRSVMSTTLWAALCVASAVMLLAVMFYKKKQPME